MECISLEARSRRPHRLRQPTTPAPLVRRLQPLRQAHPRWGREIPSPGASGINVEVATTVPAFPGFPLGVTAGSYSHDFGAG
jgi:hypothetical protein